MEQSLRLRFAGIAMAPSASFICHAPARAAETVSIGGVQAVLLKPKGEPAGSIVLMAGGDGRIGVGPGGTVARGGGL
jgi:hypothetical protein